MEDGTFVTGIEIATTISPASQSIPTKPKSDEKSLPLAKASSSNKPNRINTAATKSLAPTKNESFPQIQHTREAATAKSAGLRSSITEQQLKKPLFKKLADVKEYFDKNKSPDAEKLKSASALKPAIYWKTKKEERDDKNYTTADAFNLKIVEKFDKLYQSKKETFNSATFENLAKKKHFFEEIEKQEAKVQGEQKKFNDIAYEMAKKQAALDKLITLGLELEKKLVDTADLEGECEKKVESQKEWLAKIELEEHNNKCLQHMKQQKKELLLSVKKRFFQEQDAFALYMAGVDYLKNQKREALELRKRLKHEANHLRNKGAKENLIDQEFEDLLDNEVSEFEERRNLREILKHEKEIEEELRLQQDEDERRHALAKENRWREEENKRLQKEAEHEKELNKYKKQYHEFQKVTHVSKKDQLLEYLEGLEEKTVVLENEIEHVDQEMKAKKEELVKLQEQLKFKKFEEEKASKDKFPQDIRLDDLEIIFRSKLTEGGERENNIKRLEKVSYEVCTVISRILKQLQKSKTPVAVDQANVVNLLSVCGLKLERMLTVVIKKRKTFFIESINTDGTIKEGPPTYMNLVSDDVYNKSKKRFERELLGNIVDEELQDGQLSDVRDEIKNKEKREQAV